MSNLSLLDCSLKFSFEIPDLDLLNQIARSESGWRPRASRRPRCWAIYITWTFLFFLFFFTQQKITNLSKPRRVERRLMVVQLIIFLYKMRNEAIGLMTWFVKEWSLKRSRFVEVIHGGEMIRKVLVLTYFAQKITSVLSISSPSLWSFYPFSCEGI